MLGTEPGRRSADEITLFYGSGAGLQFAAMAELVLKRAGEGRIGRDLPDEWFLG
jgi:ornithine cyclodeaminase/alanine dehydrogenase-like protein (mu-crystallin family)